MQPETQYEYWCFICQFKIQSNAKRTQCPRCGENAIEEITTSNSPQQFQVFIKNNTTQQRPPHRPIHLQHINVVMESPINSNPTNINDFIQSVNSILSGTSRFLSIALMDMNRNGEGYMAATKQQIDRLKKVEEDKIGQCAVCQTNDHKQGVQLGCGHKFHKQCIIPWFQKCDNCPLCRCKLL